MNSLEQFIQQKYQYEQAIDNFIQWFGNSKIIDEKGFPQQVYHGSTHFIQQFDDSFSTKETYNGKGFYFTDSSDDASDNYASLNGPDVINKLHRIEDDMTGLDSDEYAELFDTTIEYIESLDDEEMERKIHDYAHKKVTGGNQGNVTPVYLKMENPLIFDRHHGTQFDWFCELTGNGTIIEDIIKKTAQQFNNSEIDLTIEMNDIAMDIQDEILGGAIDNVADILKHFEQQLQTIELEQSYSHLYKDIATYFKNSVYERIGDDETNIELNETFYGSLYDFIEHTKDFINNQTVIQSQHETEHLIGQLLERINLEPFSDFSINVQVLKEEMDAIEELTLLEMDDEYGSLMYINNIFNDFARHNDYDGIIVNPNETHFANMKHINDNVRHYVVFDPNNIKSAIGNSGDFSLNHNDICHRIEQSRSNQRLDEFNINKTIDAFKQLFPNAPDIHKSQENYKHIKGYYNDDSIYIIENNIESESDLNKTLFHEAFHAGFRQAFGQNSRVHHYLHKVFEYFNNEQKLNTIQDRYQLNFNHAQDRLIAAEEKLAEITQKGNELPFKHQLEGNLRHEFQKLDTNTVFDQCDIDFIIQTSLNQLKQKPSPQKDSKIVQKPR